MTKIFLGLFFLFSFGNTLHAAEARPFAPLPLGSKLVFNARQTVYAGYTISPVSEVFGVGCEIRLPKALTYDLSFGPETVFTVWGGHVQKAQWEGQFTRFFRTNQIGQGKEIPDYSRQAEVRDRIFTAFKTEGLGSDPFVMAESYGVGGLFLRSNSGDTVMLLCSKAVSKGGALVPTLPALSETLEFIGVALK